MLCFTTRCHLHQDPSYLKDTTDFLQKLLSLGPLPQGEQALETRPSPIPPTTYLTKMIELILKLNNFSFNEEHYLQVQGTGMGTRMAPSYANLFMAKLEEDLLAWTFARPHTW